MSAILEAASQLFDRGAATTTAIAQRAGVSIGSLYEYFRDKDAILDALIDRHVREGEAEVQAALDEVDPQKSVEANVRHIVDVILRMHSDRPALHRRLINLGMSQPAVRRRVAEAERNVRPRLEHWLRDHPDVDHPDPALAARILAQGTNALVHLHIEDPEDLADDRLREELTRLWTAYLSRPPRS